MQELTEAERKQAARLGLSEEQAAVSLGMGIPLERYAARRSAEESAVDVANAQARSFEELARGDPFNRTKLQFMAAEARARADQLRAELANNPPAPAEGPTV